MPLYGYKISGMASSERYFEAETLLDKKLKGYEKSPASFEKDGSRKQVYTLKNEDGSATEVILVKNVTECGVMVFSDVPLKIFRFGGKIFYLRDIIPTVLYAAFLWLLLPYLWGRVRLSEMWQMLLVQLIAGVLLKIIGRITKIPLRKDRSKLRIRTIQYGSVVTLVLFVYYITRLFSTARWSGMYLLKKLLYETALPAIIVSIILDILTEKHKRSG